MIYFLLDEGENAVKIGHAVSPQARIDALQCGNPRELKLLGLIDGDQKAERRLHQRFARLRRKRYRNGDCEWFNYTPELADAISNLLNHPEHGYPAVEAIGI